MYQKAKGMGAILCAMFVFSSINALFKTIEKAYPIIMILFLRNLFSLIPYIIILFTTKDREALRIDNYHTHFFRAVLSIISLGCLFKSFMLLPLAEAITLSYLSCIGVVLLSVPMLGEKVTKYSWGVISLGFVGVIIVADPGGEITSNGLSLAFISATIEAFLMVQGRRLTAKNTNLAIVLYQSLFAFLVTGAGLPLVWISPSYYDLVVFALLGIGGGIGQYLITVAYRHAPPQLLSPLMYTSLLWAILYSHLFLDETPTFSLYLGASLIIVAGLLVIYQKNILNKETT